MKQGLLISIIALTMLALNGCASKATVEGMTSRDFSASSNKKLAQAIEIDQVGGGQETNPMWTSKIADSDFKLALRDSLRNAGMLAASPEKARYLLRATIHEVDQPLMGLDMSVRTSVHYTLTDAVSKKIVFSKEVKAVGTATMGDAFYGVKRLRLANEGSARKNITELLTTLQSVDPAKVTLSLH